MSRATRFERPSASLPRMATASKTALRLEQGERGVHFDIPRPLYQKIRVRCAEKGLNLKAYFLELLATDGLQ